MKAILILALGLSACATTTKTVVICPTIVTYQPSSYDALAAEKKGPETKRWLQDYIKSRDAARACLAGH